MRARQGEELQRSGGCGRMGAAAADITWRYFTWEDSVAKVTPRNCISARRRPPASIPLSSRPLCAGAGVAALPLAATAHELLRARRRPRLRARPLLLAHVFSLPPRCRPGPSVGLTREGSGAPLLHRSRRPRARDVAGSSGRLGAAARAGDADGGVLCASAAHAPSRRSPDAVCEPIRCFACSSTAAVIAPSLRTGPPLV